MSVAQVHHCSKRKRDLGDQSDRGDNGLGCQRLTRHAKKSRRYALAAIQPCPPANTTRDDQSFTFVSSPEHFSLESQWKYTSDNGVPRPRSSTSNSRRRRRPRNPPAPVVEEPTPSTKLLRESLDAISLEVQSRLPFPSLKYGYCQSKKYRFTSPLSPIPGKRRKSSTRLRSPKRSPGPSLLKRTLLRNHDEMQKKWNLSRHMAGPSPSIDSVPPLDEDDDEFDDDEEDEIIDFDDDDQQVTDIVDMYSRDSTPEPEANLFESNRVGLSDEEPKLCISPPPVQTRVKSPPHPNLKLAPHLGWRSLSPLPPVLANVRAVAVHA